MTKLSEKKCSACAGETTPLEGEKLNAMSSELGGGWKVVNEHHLEKDFQFKDFKEALHFANCVGAIAEEEGHHPDIHLAWGKARIILWTHTINGLSESDFVLAAKIDLL